jgi:hypothetical protein
MCPQVARSNSKDSPSTVTLASWVPLNVMVTLRSSVCPSAHR